VEVGENELLPWRSQQGVELIHYPAVLDPNYCHRASGIALVICSLEIDRREAGSSSPASQRNRSWISSLAVWALISPQALRLGASSTVSIRLVIADNKAQRPDYVSPAQQKLWWRAAPVTKAL
jgi:hypothetical protein